ncbi:MAG: DNA adenine methylase [Candidatus Hodarchaeales archaeon]|jgi:adenine-specific DNA methylase
MNASFPQTRYQGSKLKLIDWFLPIFQGIKFKTVLDAFGGTGAVSYLFKKMNKQVTYNDLLVSNWYIGKALIENNSKQLDPLILESLYEKKNDFLYQTVIQDQFSDIYFIDEENKLLDIIVQNIHQIEDLFEKALCFFALFQACIQKRPFNLFHRKNLYLRLSNVERSFGNKKTWDTPFSELILRSLNECNRAVFNNNKINKVFNSSILDIPAPDEEPYDMVYLDPPYISPEGVGVDYRDFYHFLEGICNYYNWEGLIDYNSKHRRLKVIKNDWNDPKSFLKAFERTIAKFQDSILVISYRDPGIPSIESLKDVLLSYKTYIKNFNHDYKYALTTARKTVKEVLLVTN